MANFTISGLEIVGIAACVPPVIETVHDLPFANSEAHQRKIHKSTGVFSRRIDNGQMTTSDLCVQATKELFTKTCWNPNDINILIFLSQSFDYMGVPATSCAIHQRLGLPSSCLCYDIVLGCSGYPYGLSQIFTQLSFLKGKGLLLTGDTMGKHFAKHDPVVATLFGAAGTATAVEYTDTNNQTYFDLNTDGRGKEVIMIPEGGARCPFSNDSLDLRKCEDGVDRNGLQMRMKGIDIVNFSLTKPIESIINTLNDAALNLDQIDYFVFHQANLIIVNGITKKLGIPEQKVLTSLEHFGNTSSASIPLTLVYHALSIDFAHKKILLCGYGVGLSWGTTILDFRFPIFTNVLEYHQENCHD